MAPLAQPPTFLPHVHAKLSPSTYLAAHLTSTPPTRPSGRSPTQSRPPTIHTGSLTHAHGSAVLRQGDTAIVCGVRGEILYASSIPSAKPFHQISVDGGEGGRKRKRDTKEGGRGDEGRERGRDVGRDGRRDMKELKELGLLVPNIELNTGCSPDYLPGGPPSATAQVLSQRLVSALYEAGVVGLGGLRIWAREEGVGGMDGDGDGSEEEEGGVSLGGAVGGEGEGEGGGEVKAFWTLYIDLLVISLDHGSNGLFDALWLAMLAALGDTKLPHAEWDGEKEQVLGDPDMTKGRKLELRAELPIASSYCVFAPEDRITARAKGGEDGKKWVLSDPDAFEEELCEEVVTVIVVGEGRVMRIEKSGGEGLGVEGLKEVVGMAEQRRLECLGVLREEG